MKACRFKSCLVKAIGYFCFIGLAFNFALAQTAFSPENMTDICAAGEVQCDGVCYPECADPLFTRKPGSCNTCSCATGCSVSGQNQNSTTCACSCPVGQTTCVGSNSCVASCSISGQTMDPLTCSCNCGSGTSLCTNSNPDVCATTCGAGKVFNAACTGCVCGSSCSAPKTVQDASTCACSCPACAVTGQTQNTTTCACACPSGQSVCANTNPDKCATTCVFPFVFNAACTGCTCPTNFVPAQAPFNTTKCCPTATPYWNGSACVKCLYFTGTSLHSSSASGAIFKNSTSATLTAFKALSCVQDIASGCGTTVSGSVTSNSSIDFCVFSRFACLAAQKALGASVCDFTPGGSISWAKVSGPSNTCISGDPCYNYIGPGSLNVSRTFTMDNDCNNAGSVSGAQVCSGTSVNELQSPISLIWKENSDIESQVSITQFALDPSKPGSWYSWKASANTPLLVFDPEHRGEIKSGRDLFGNWTFGEKKLASLIGKDAPLDVNKPQPWVNGYEALKTLDLNNDGSVSGQELDDVGLWFDNNQDGVSQSGEVKRLSEVGVTKLFYQPDRVDQVTGNIFASIGYERMVDGKMQKGASVDWFGESFKTQSEAMLRQQLENVLTGVSVDSKIEAKDENSSEAGAAAPADAVNKIVGGWKWTIQEDEEKLGIKGVPFYGLMTIAADKNDKSGQSIVGHTYTETGLTPVYPGIDEAKSVVGVTGIGGRVALNKKGEVELQFRTLDKKRPVTTNRATLSEDGKTLTGSSDVTLPRTDQPGKTRQVHYTWKAERF